MTILILIGCVVLLGVLLLAWSLATASKDDWPPSPFDD